MNNSIAIFESDISAILCLIIYKAGFNVKVIREVSQSHAHALTRY